MQFKQITSRDNPIYRQLKRLADSSRERRKEGKTLLDGVHLLTAYAAHIGLPELLIVPQGASTAEANALLQQWQDIPTLMLPTLLFAELSPVVTPSGIMAQVLIPQLPVVEPPRFVLLLEDIQDPGNLGSLLRTAAAAGVDNVYLSAACADPWSPKCLRGGQGAQFVLPVQERQSLPEFLESFNGKAFAATLDGQPCFAQDLRLPLALAIGNEGAGLSASLIQACQQRMTIPLAQGVESLNAAAAAAVCLFEVVRQNGAYA